MIEKCPLHRCLFAGLALLLIPAGCGDDADQQSSTPSPTQGAPLESTTTTTTPVSGGSLTFGSNSAIAGLDPTVASGSGSTGGVELTALYDTLLRWNTKTFTYDPALASSITANADSTEWTLKLRPAVKFTDGTPLDAAAVKFNIDRHLAASSRSSAKASLAVIKSTTVVDSQTIVFALTQSWAGFPVLLTREGGMIASPTAIQTLGSNFNLNPVGAGAGPFELVSFKPNESVVMKRNANYWNGPAYLDEIRFVFIAGFPNRYDALRANTVNIAFLRDAAVIATAKADGYEGLSTLAYGAGWSINMAANMPGANAKVRQAIVAALDADAVSQRARAGKAVASKGLLTDRFPWNPGVADPKFDGAEARRLVQEAKAAGWDGKLRLTCHNGLTDLATVTQSLLLAAGMDVTVSNDMALQGYVTLLAQKDFQVACLGLTVHPDDSAVVTLETGLGSASPSNRISYANPRFDSAVAALRRATTDAAKKSAFKDIVETLNADAPIAFFEAVEEFAAHRNNVKGLVGHTNGVVLLDKVWLAR